MIPDISPDERVGAHGLLGGRARTCFIPGAMDFRPAIVVSDLRVSRGGAFVLPGLSLTVAAGIVTGLLGPSGSGKTTLMRAIVGVQLVERGTIAALGRPAGSPESETRGLRDSGAVAVRGPDVARTSTTSPASWACLASASTTRCETVDLTDLADQVARTLSGGERSRVSLAGALLGQPDLLVLDEPTVGLDPVLRRDLWRTFHSLADAGATVLVSSHVMDEAERCDDLLLMRDGRLVASGAAGRATEEDRRRATSRRRFSRWSESA